MLAAALPHAAFPAWSAHPDVWLVVSLMAVTYYLAIRRVGPKVVAPGEPVITAFQVRCFVVALVAIWIASDWPVHELSEHYLYSVHMVQHVFYSMIAAPFLLLATPAWMARWFLNGTHTLRLVRQLSRFFWAVLVFNAVFIVIHTPAVVSASLHSGLIHFLLHALVLVAGLIVWMPVISPLPEVPRLEPPLQMFYLFTQSILPTLPSAMLTFGGMPLYKDYAHFGRLWGISVASDEGIAGLIMKVGIGLMLWIAIAIVFFKWSATEESFAHTHGRQRGAPRSRGRAVATDGHGDLDRELLGLHRS
jgi:putative membrane protein